MTPFKGVLTCTIDLYDQGYHYVVDLDLKAYFDTVNHDMLMKFLKYEITDEWTLRLRSS